MKPPPATCIADASCPPGQWIDVTPPSVDLVNGTCGNFGPGTVQVDPRRPQDLYVSFSCQGVWKSTDYGQTWKGPINTGTHGADVGTCAGGIAIPPGDAGAPPVIYEACIRDDGSGNGIGFWRSDDGGVDWTRYAIAPGGARQDFYPPAVDPHDPKHLLMAGHENPILVESIDGGATWTNVAMAPGMIENGGTGGIRFIDTGAPATTRTTWLWIGAVSAGTWRTEVGATGWSLVDANLHPHAYTQIYQPNTGGVLYMAGEYSKLGDGVLRSTDYGKTWTHVGTAGPRTIVFGTSKSVYSMFGWAIGAGQTVDPDLEIAAQPGLGTWTKPGTPPAMTQGPTQAAVTSDGTYNIVVTANFNAGLWRYVEPLE
jgi:hypothetical protein